MGMEKRECLRNCVDDDLEDVEKEEEFYVSYPLGTDYCMEVGECREACGFDKDEEDLEDNDYDDDCFYTSCPPGTSYCMAQQQCVPDCETIDKLEEEIEEDIECPFGTIY